MTFSAKPWLVIHREIRTPIAASLSLPTHDAAQPFDAFAPDAEITHRADDDFLEVADITVHIQNDRA